MQLSDEQLVAAYLNDDDQRAFTELVERHKDRIFNFIMSMVKDRSLANDLFQDTFLRVISAMHARRASYEQQGRWIYWVIRIARNATLDHLRSRKKFVDVNANQEAEDYFWTQLKDESPDAVDEMQKAQQSKWLEKSIAQLPEEQQEVLMLRQDAGLTFREIAAMTNCSINTALGRMRYALINLEKIMSQSPERQLADFNQ